MKRTSKKNSKIKKTNSSSKSKASSHKKTPATKRSSLTKSIHKNLRDKTPAVEKELSESNVRWESLNDLNQQLKEVVGKFLEEITPIIAAPNIENSLPEEEKKLFVKLRSTLQRDIEGLVTKMEELHNEHKDKSGLITSVDEYSQYVDFSVRYDSLHSLTMSKMEPLLAELISCISKQSDQGEGSPEPDPNANVPDVDGNQKDEQ